MQYIKSKHFLDKCILLLLCLFIFWQTTIEFQQVFFILSALIISFALDIWTGSVALVVAGIGTFILAIYYPPFFTFFPVIFYSIFRQNWQRNFFISLIILSGSIFLQSAVNFPLYVLLLLSQYLRYHTLEQTRLENTLMTNIDQHQLRTAALELKNQNLIAEQNQSLQMGIAGERNRIARDIHDSVGHLLSSSIIQLGAINVINEDTALAEPLDKLKATVEQGMNAIRHSVHHLYDDSLHLEKSIIQMVQDFNFCPIELEYTIKSDVSIDVKMDILMIVKEALANIMKHSDATLVDAKLLEYNGFYKILIIDNGKIKTKSTDNDFVNNSTNGLGIASMRKRIRDRNGNFSASFELDGFRVLAIIQKENLIVGESSKL